MSPPLAEEPNGGNAPYWTWEKHIASLLASPSLGFLGCFLGSFSSQSHHVPDRQGSPHGGSCCWPGSRTWMPTLLVARVVLLG